MQVISKSKEKDNTMVILDKVSKLSIISDLKTSDKSFLIVRHPFHRLVSAFRDKFEHSHPPHKTLQDFYFLTYGQNMTQKFRRKALKKFGPDFFSKENNYGTPLPIKTGERTQVNMIGIAHQFKSRLQEVNIAILH